MGWLVSSRHQYFVQSTDPQGFIGWWVGGLVGFQPSPVLCLINQPTGIGWLVSSRHQCFVQSTNWQAFIGWLVKHYTIQVQYTHMKTEILTLFTIHRWFLCIGVIRQILAEPESIETPGITVWIMRLLFFNALNQLLVKVEKLYFFFLPDYVLLCKIVFRNTIVVLSQFKPCYSSREKS